jgi:hypothetical protein
VRAPVHIWVSLHAPPTCMHYHSTNTGLPITMPKQYALLLAHICFCESHLLHPQGPHHRHQRCCVACRKRSRAACCTWTCSQTKTTL